MSTQQLSPRTIYLPAATGPDRAVPAGPTLASRALAAGREFARACVSYYREPLSWLALGVTSVILCYGGGAAMFWFHSEHLGEGGPNIPWYVHWLLDSTFGFLALTPALVLILPLASLVVGSTAGRLAPRAVPAAFAVLAGVVFAFVTTPGPVAHDLFVGRGTWIATQATQLWGQPGVPLTPVHHYSLLAKMTQQLGFGLPVYVILMGLAVLVIRSIAVRSLSDRGAAGR